MDFSVATLGELSIGDGKYGIAASAVDYDAELPAYLRITDINDDGTLNWNDRKSVNDSDAYKYMLSEGDIVFARTGNSTGRNYYYDSRDGEFAFAGFLIRFSLDDKKVNPRYVKYYAQSKAYWDWIASFNTGSTRGNINAKTYAQMPVPLPDRSTQDSIVMLCDSISNKIRLNTTLNGYLDELSAAVFVNWLTKHAGGKEVASLTTDDDHLSLGELCSKVTDGSHSSPRNNPNGKYSMLSVRDMRRFGFDYTSCKKINRLDFDTMVASDCVPKVDDILVAKDGSYLKEIFITNEERHEAVLSSIAIFRPDKRAMAPEILLRFLKHPRIQKLVADNFVSGSALPRIVLKDFKKLALLTPSRKEQAEILPILQMIRSLTWANQVESEQLTNLRDVLLPKLIAGEIDVSKVHITQLNDERRIH